MAGISVSNGYVVYNGHNNDTSATSGYILQSYPNGNLSFALFDGHGTLIIQQAIVAPYGFADLAWQGQTASEEIEGPTPGGAYRCNGAWKANSGSANLYFGRVGVQYVRNFIQYGARNGLSAPPNLVYLIYEDPSQVGLDNIQIYVPRQQDSVILSSAFTQVLCPPPSLKPNPGPGHHPPFPPRPKSDTQTVSP